MNRNKKRVSRTRLFALLTSAVLLLSLAGCESAQTSKETGDSSSSVSSSAQSTKKKSDSGSDSTANSNSTAQKATAKTTTEQNDKSSGSSKSSSTKTSGTKTSDTKASGSKSSSSGSSSGKASSGTATSGGQSTASSGSKYHCAFCGTGRDYPNQICPGCGSVQFADPTVYHYHGDGFNNGICPSCGLVYTAVTQEDLDNGIIPGSPACEKNGYGPDGKLLPGWVMGPNGSPIREEDYVPLPTTFEDGCPLSGHLYSGNCNDHYIDGCWGSGHTYSGSCMFAPQPTPPADSSTTQQPEEPAGETPDTPVPSPSPAPDTQPDSSAEVTTDGSSL